MIKSRPGAKQPGVVSQPTSYSLCDLRQVTYPLRLSVSSSLKSGMSITTFQGGGYEDRTSCHGKSA